MNYCEMCGRKNMVVRWYVIDDNMETELCGTCAKEMRKAGEKVEAIKWT